MVAHYRPSQEQLATDRRVMECSQESTRQEYGFVFVELPFPRVTLYTHQNDERSRDIAIVDVEVTEIEKALAAFKIKIANDSSGGRIARAAH